MNRAAPLRTVALELVPSTVDGGVEGAVEEAGKARRLIAEAGLGDQIRHVMMPGIIEEDDGRPVEMKPRLDVLDYWSVIGSELPGTKALCTQVTSFLDKRSLETRLATLVEAGIEGIAFVGVPRTMSDGEGEGVAPADALALFDGLVRHRGVILIPTRNGEAGRFGFKCDRGATYGMTQLLHSDAIVSFLTDFAKTSEHRPEILLSFGFVPSIETRVGLIDWLIQDPGNPVVAAEQQFVRRLSGMEPGPRRQSMLDLYKRVIDGVADLDFPLSVHLEATYGVCAPAFDLFAEMLDYWSPITLS